MKKFNNKGDISIEAAIIVPLILIISLGLLQLAFWFYATNLLKTAARDGLNAARLQNAIDTDAGRAAVHEITDKLPAGLMIVNDKDIDIHQEGDDVVLRLNAELKSVVLEIPYMYTHSDARAPIEMWKN